MRYLSICSGIGAASVAWGPLNWTPLAFAEVNSFCSWVLYNRFISVYNKGDFTQIGADDFGPLPPDLVVGGPPCQDFSIAGLRAGLGGARGALTVEFVRLLERLHPRWVVWENVSGVLSIDDGRAFGTFLGLLGQLGYGTAYRVLNAAYFGVPQRRRRVFVVGYLGDWRPPAAVLFERSSLCGHFTPSPQAGAHVASLTANGLGGGGPDDNLAQAGHLIAFSCKDDGRDAGELSPTLRAMSHQVHANAGGQVAVASPTGVRRLTPRECERLQGFPDDWTLIPYKNDQSPDGLRYRALGNSMAVPVVRWLGERIALVNSVI